VSVFDVSLVELAERADELSASPDMDTFSAHVRVELDRMMAQCRACSVHLVVRWGSRPDQQLVVYGDSSRVAVGSFASALEATDGWLGRIVAAGVSVIDVGSTDDQLREVMEANGVVCLWLVGGARSVPGTSHSVFAFCERPKQLEPVEATALTIRNTLLISRAIGRLATFEWDHLVALPADATERSFLFETDQSGDLIRWPYELETDDRRLATQMIAADRRTVAEAVDAILGGATTSYELIVRRPSGSGVQTIRLLARRSPRGGVEGIVLPPSLPVSVLPAEVASLLSPREREVARLLAAGFRVRQVGERLYLSQNTVRNHLKNIFTKLQVSSQVELIALINEPSRGKH
jgi:DNA-binding CsgD family transcriptional regulator